MEFLLVICDDENARQQASTDQREQEMAAYREYTQMLIQAGVMRGGNALEGTAGGRRVSVRGGKRITVDGPFAETKEQLAGYYLIDCADLKEAEDWAAKLPASLTGYVEVRQIHNY